VEKIVVHLDFSQQQSAARSADGWMQGRYYCADGLLVREFLSFDSVFEINRFECPSRSEKRMRSVLRARYRACRAQLYEELELADLMPRAFQTLSNGEMRRVLFARALLRLPDVVLLNDPMAGLDPSRRTAFRRLIRRLARDGIDVRLTCRYDDERPVAGSEPAASLPVPTATPAPTPHRNRSVVVAIRHLDVAFGRRTLFKDFSWTIRAGEHWVLRGPNGSGKTLLTAIITGDSPLGYANDVTVFGQRRGTGELAAIRRRIALVSPELLTYTDTTSQRMLDDAFARKPDLLILDEPCLNLDPSESTALLARVSTWLACHPRTAAVVIAHRAEHIPPTFTRVIDLGKRRPARADAKDA